MSWGIHPLFAVVAILCAAAVVMIFAAAVAASRSERPDDE